MQQPSRFRITCEPSLLDSRRSKTRAQPSAAILECHVIVDNRQRQHSSLGMLTPVGYELRHATTTVRD